MTDTPNDRIAKFQTLLRELFQFDSADLDFGIYRIMNRKRGVIERFVSTDLPNVIDAELRGGALARQAEAAAALEETRQRLVDGLGAGALDPDGGVANPGLADTPLAQAYLQARAFAGAARSHAAVEADVYNHLYAFFARYYQDGDFISKRRYGRGARYAVPYNGEEVYLHWANRDQYYIKTAEYFHNYDWRARNGVAVHFRLDRADVDRNNVKSARRFFVPRTGDAQWNPDRRVVTVPFAYRPLSAAEEKTYGRGDANRQDKIAAAAAEALAARFDAPDAQAALNAEPAADGEPAPVERHLRRYARRNDSDFFIHRDLRGFLSRELDFYLKNEVLNLDNLTAAGERIADGWFQELRVIKSVGGKIIDFLAQIEDFQKMLWEKRKFVTETGWCVALRCIPQAFHAEIAANDAQWAEWRALSIIDDETAFLANGAKTRGDRIAFLKENPTSMVDTAHFDDDFADRLLAAFDDLDGATDGLLVHGENWQALRLLENTYAGDIQHVYIDPPYNTAIAPILYKNDYKHSSWLGMLENRLAASARLTSDSGVVTIAIDENEQERLGLLLSSLFPNRAKTCVTVVHNPGGIQGENFSYNNEFSYFVYPARGRAIGRLSRDDNADVRPLRDVSTGQHLRTDAANCFYPILVKDKAIVGFGEVCADGFHPAGANVARGDGTVEVYPIDASGTERKWVFGRQNIEAIESELAVEWNRRRGIWDIIRRKTVFNYKTVWDDKRFNANSYGSKLLKSIFGSSVFTFPKSLHTVSESIHLATDRAPGDTIVLDYFAGSGTTGHAAMRLNRRDGKRRKFILVEMDKCFDIVLLPRIKKIAFAPEWKDGKPSRTATQDERDRSPRIVEYIRIESYEDSMDSIRFDEAAGRRLEERIEGYVLNYMLKWETKDSETLLNPAKLTDPFAYRLRVRANGNALERPVDVAETFNYLIGLRVRTRRVYMDDDRRYLVFRGETRAAPGRVTVAIWRATDGWTEADYRRDRRFVAETKIADDADDIYVNGDSCIVGARPVEPLFKARMFAGASGSL